ncbi:fibroblast growth factor receptor homolog 1-like isoform X2 [Planococcus citri]|uniref:fibroblast growth factor receptor homolog 1-like isoform X2 n=1 Tax=Planococcus citri TaxID=170843 RepID=UPI0031F8BF8D
MDFTKKSGKLIRISTVLCCFLMLMCTWAETHPINKVKEITLKRNQTNETFKDDDEVNLVCSAPSPDLKNITYTWYKDGKSIESNSKDHIKIDKQWLKFRANKKKHNGTFSCLVNWIDDENNTVENYWQNITVNVQPRIFKMKQNVQKPRLEIMSSKADIKEDIKLQPESSNSVTHVVKIYGENFTFSCPTSKNKHNSVKWYKNDVEIKERRDSQNWTMNNLTNEDNGIDVRCETKTSSDHHHLHAYKLHVFKSKDEMPIIVEGPTNTTVFNGDNASFTCFVSNLSDSNITWLNRSTEHPSSINITRTMCKASIDSSHINSDPQKLVIRDVNKRSSGWYTCVVCTPSTTVTSSAWLEVEDVDKAANRNDDEENDDAENDTTEHEKDTTLKPSKPLGPSAPSFRKKDDLHPTVAKPAGNSVELKCPATGNPTPNITWLKDGFPATRILGVMKPRGKWSIIMEDSNTNDEGNYTCVVCNMYGCINHTFKVKIVERVFSKPLLIQAPQNMTIVVGEPSNFSCEFFSDLHPYIAWFKANIKNDDERDKLEKYMVKENEANLELSNVTYEDAGWYTCVAANNLGATYASAYLNVVDELEDPFKMPIMPSPYSRFTTIIIVILSTSFVIAVMIVICILRRFKKERQKKLIALETLTHWTKKIIIEKAAISNENLQGPLQMPIVKIERQKAQSVRTDSFSASEYELPVDSDWEFPRENLQLGKSLGEGAFGKVVKAEAFGILQPNANTTVAVKMLKEQPTDTDMMDLVSEMELMKVIGRHRNILNLLGCCTQGGILLVIVEYAPHGNLRDFLRQHRHSSGYEPAIGAPFKEKTLSEKTLVNFSYQIARGMEYLASKRCIHRDLAARNILVSDNYEMKIADFGLARDIHNNDYYRKTTDGRLPVKWMAPEALFHRVYTSQSDVWSYGVLLWEIMTLGGVPYPTIPNMEELFKLLRTGHRMEKPVHCSLQIYYVMRDCWSYDPNDRPEFSTIVKELEEILMNYREYLDLEPPELETPSTSPESSDSEDHLL